MIQEKILIYANLLAKQYNKTIIFNRIIDVYNLNDPLFLYDNLHIYLFFGSLIPDQNIGNIIKSEFRLLNGTTVLFYADYSKTAPPLNNINILFDRGIENGSGVLNGYIIEYTIL